METKTIPMRPTGVEHREQAPNKARKNIDRSLETVRQELRSLMQSGSSGSDGGSYADHLEGQSGGVIQEAVNLVTQGGQSSTKFVDQTKFHELAGIHAATGGKHETIVGIQTSDDGQVTAVNELESAQKSHDSVAYKAEDVSHTQAISHNHPTHSDKAGEVVLQGFSEQDILTNQRTEKEITKTQGVEVAQKYTHFLGKECIIDGQSYQTVVASGLGNDDNTKWQTFTVGDTEYHQATRCPDGQIRDVMQLPQHVAAEILYNRLMAVDHANDDFVNMAA